MTRVGVLTGGGDCPGLDAVIRATVRRGLALGGHSFLGFRDGWAGVLLDDALELTLESTSGILPRGGTMLGTSRTDPLAGGLEAVETIRRTLASRGVDALVVIGGDGTLGAARDLLAEGIPLVAVPKTIDNDVAGTDLSVGFQTAVQIATDAIDRLHTTAESHNRVIVVEVMGRSAGWIATYSGIAGGADVILIPEVPFDIDQVAELIKQRHARGRYFSIVVAAEGAQFCDGNEKHGGGSPDGRDEFGHVRLGGIGSALASEIEKRTGFETRSVVLGHIQRGGSPTAYDRVLATRYGLGAIDMVHRGEFGQMAALRGNKIVSVPLAEAIATNRKVDKEILDAATGILDKLDYKVANVLS